MANLMGRKLKDVRVILLAEIHKYSSLIVIGETGSGKTTQIPQFMHEVKLDRDGMIGVTQPRRVAAMTISQRVAQEMNTTLGELVGYSVRFEDVTSKCTKLKYLTDGMLLREALLDPLLLSYSVIVLDEAHERTVHTDILFGVVKQAQKFRTERSLKPLKILVMSATMDVDHFSHYFGNIPVVYLEGRQYPVQVFHAIKTQEDYAFSCLILVMSATMDVDHFSHYFGNIPVVYLEGRQYPVQVFHAIKTQEDYAFSCLVTIFQIHKDAPPNWDILVFLTGQEEIEAMAYNIRLISKDLEGKCVPLKVYPLYSSLPSHMQLDVFRPTAPGMRKVILSTNIAETSVTISGIKYIIDSGMVKNRSHHPGTGLDVLKVQRISQAQAWQRTGRAGRESPGFCYRTYTHQEFDSFRKNPIPEIQRCNLTSVVLQLLTLGINPSSFDFMDKPPVEYIDGAIEQLKQLGAIESTVSPKLTATGHLMAQFPLDPRYSKIIISAKDYNCVQEILTIVAMLSGESVFVNPPAKREKAVAAQNKFYSTAGDHITLLNIYRNYNNVAQKKIWCQDNFLNSRNLQYASKVRTQLSELCERCKVPMSSCGQDTEPVRKCLITGLFMNVAELQREKKYVTEQDDDSECVFPRDDGGLKVITIIQTSSECYSVLFVLLLL
uniref:RNA helicase n=1 Tax=Timema cristinae TaxID=61476 RepID=A0A7R9GRP8_TIMCR|nr:unnamed protein product [Timema cristinae]